MHISSLLSFAFASTSVTCLLLAGCRTTLPSDQLRQSVPLPVPSSAFELPNPDRLRAYSGGDALTLTPRSVVSLAFNLRPDIRSSFHRFKSEEARYDFFFATRDALTPRVVVSNAFDEARTLETVDREREHTVEVGVEKRFFDTSEVSVGAGYRSHVAKDDFGNAPFLRGEVHYPLHASRQKLERTSEDIFRQNERNDAQLDYIDLVRSSLEGVLSRFYKVVFEIGRVRYHESWVHDLERLLADVVQDRGNAAARDAQRVRSELARVRADLRNTIGNRNFETIHLKAEIGVPLDVELDLRDEPFNPFSGNSHQQLFLLSIAADPEIATLRNSVSNAKVQLDLARRGTWDVAFLLSGEANLQGRGSNEASRDWRLNLGLDISAVDPRVTASLGRQAQANIARFEQSIAARENAIFAKVFEPLRRIETYGASRSELIESLPRFERDYDEALSRYRQNEFDIDILISRRRGLSSQQEEIAQLSYWIGLNVAELCAASGEFFELVKTHDGPT